jgi:hypothetical protein
VLHVKAARPATRGNTGREPHAVSLAGQVEDRELKSPEPALDLRPTACLSIFDGREAVGHVAPLGARFEAYFSSDISCGVFDSAEDALAAISAEEDAT